MSAVDILGVDNAMLSVGDFEKALDFYGSKLALPLKFQMPGMGLAGFRLGQEEPGLFVKAGGVPEQGPRESPRLWLEVVDARLAADELRARGLTPLADPFEVVTGWTVEFADPWGNVIGLTDYTTAPERARKAAPQAQDQDQP